MLMRFVAAIGLFIIVGALLQLLGALLGAVNVPFIAEIAGWIIAWGWIFAFGVALYWFATSSGWTFPSFRGKGGSE